MVPSRASRLMAIERDIVCGKEVEVDFHQHKKLWQGVVYHFCSEECRDTFAEDPQEYLTIRR